VGYVVVFPFLKTSKRLELLQYCLKPLGLLPEPTISVCQFPQMNYVLTPYLHHVLPACVVKSDLLCMKDHFRNVVLARVLDTSTTGCKPSCVKTSIVRENRVVMETGPLVNESNVAIYYKSGYDILCNQ
jgi:GTP:adenosylcobinamide-phosphate guanylyltransferase